MKITNFAGLPEAFVKAIENDSYDRGQCDFTITELLKPARQVVLQRRFADQITEDAADMLYRLHGQIVHGILHRANMADLSEKRFFSIFLGKVISGQIDSLSLDDGVLTDYKYTTVWKFKRNSLPDPDYVAQLNMQLELLRRNGLDAKKLQIVGMLRDFRMREAMANPDSYPQSQTVVLNIPIWPRHQTVEYIETRIRLIEVCETELLECSNEERWAKDDIHAVMKGQRAINGGLKTTHQAALEMHKNNPGTRIVFRPAENTRCDRYCTVSKFCAQYQKLSERTLK